MLATTTPFTTVIMTAHNFEEPHTVRPFVKSADEPKEDSSSSDSNDDRELRQVVELYR